MKSGLLGIALILLIAVCRVAVTSGLAGLLKPMWLSVICTKLKPPPLQASLPLLLVIARETGMPPLNVQNSPVLAHAMHFRQPRPSTPPFFRFINILLS